MWTTLRPGSIGTPLQRLSVLPDTYPYYDEAPGPLGYHREMEYDEAAGFTDGKNTDFWIESEMTVAARHPTLLRGAAPEL